MQMSIQWMNKVSTGISEVFVIDFGLYFGFLWRVRLFVRHFGWYLGLYFGFLLRKLFRMVFVMHFGFLDAGKKNKY